MAQTVKIIDLIESRFSIALTHPARVLSVSNDIDNLLGFKEEVFRNGNISLQSLIHPHDQDIADVLFSNEMHPASGIFNIRLRHADGRIRCLKGQYTKNLEGSAKVMTLDLLLQDAKSLWQQQDDQTMMVNFKAMMDNTDDYIYFKDRNHVFTAASQTLVAITDPAEHWTDLIGKTDYDVFSEEYADIYYTLEKQVFSGVHLAHEVQETLDKNGNKGWVDNRKYPIKNDEGEIIGLFGIARDITERKLIEEALRKKELQLSLVLEGSNLGFWDWDISSGKVERNHIWAEMLGYTYEEMKLTTNQWADFLHPNDLESAWKSIYDALEGRTSEHELVYRMRTKSGEYKWILDRAKVVLRDEQGKALRMTGTHTDYTKRKEDDKKINESEERLRLALSAANQSWFELNIASGEVSFGPEYAHMLGYDPANFRSSLQEWLENIHPEDIEAVRESLQECLRNGGTKSADYRRRNSSGEWVWLNSIGSIVGWDENNHPLRMIGIHTNITERKKLESKLIKRANFDYLTGLSNRGHFMKQGEVELSRAIRYHKALSLLMIDIDSFKNINDAYGHQVGDLVLKALSQICQEALRQADIAGRLGGEEFAIILPEADSHMALEVAERLREVVYTTKMNRPNGLPINFTVSIGVTSLDNKNLDIDMLLNQADKALYEAKRTGRNKVCVC